MKDANVWFEYFLWNGETITTLALTKFVLFPEVWRAKHLALSSKYWLDALNE